jgi:threonine aldolase
MFASDNAAPAHPAILDALARVSHDPAPSYGGDAWTKAAEQRLRDVFETDCSVLLVATGTASCALALAALCPPWGSVLVHRYGHCVEDEAGAPIFFTGGAQLLLLDGAHTKITPEALNQEADRWCPDWVHGPQPFAVSISQATESGACYSVAELQALGQACRARGLKLHMDGARFANAVASTGATPAALTWKAGVDVVSFGATKNGALACEAIVCFDPVAARAMPHLRKRAGHLVSKHRYMAAQMNAYLDGDLWLALARHANAQAKALEAVLRGAGATILHPVQANEVFAVLSDAQAERLRAAGIAFYPWTVDGPGAYRFIASWATQASQIDHLGAALARAG